MSTGGAQNIVLLGVLFLGGFVGFIVATVLRSLRSITAKAATGIIGLALGGAPVLFMTGLDFQKWMYPIGLVIGALATRVPAARMEKANPAHINDRNIQRWAWFDMVAITALILVVVSCAAFLDIKAAQEKASKDRSPAANNGLH